MFTFFAVINWPINNKGNNLYLPLFRQKQKVKQKEKVSKTNDRDYITICIISVSVQQSKQQSFRVGCCLFTNKESTDGNTKIIIKTELIHRAINVVQQYRVVLSLSILFHTIQRLYIQILRKQAAFLLAVLCIIMFCYIYQR